MGEARGPVEPREAGEDEAGEREADDTAGVARDPSPRRAGVAVPGPVALSQTQRGARREREVFSLAFRRTLDRPRKDSTST